MRVFGFNYPIIIIFELGFQSRDIQTNPRLKITFYPGQTQSVKKTLNRYFTHSYT